MRYLKNAVVLALPLAAALLPLLASAEPSTYRIKLHDRSVQLGMEQAEIDLLAANPALTRDGGDIQILDALRQAGYRRLPADNVGVGIGTAELSTTWADDETWSLDVWHDGSRFEYWGDIFNEAEIDAARGSSLTLSDLEALGAQFYYDFLAPLSPLGPDETIEFHGSRYLDVSFEDDNGNVDSERIVNIAEFTRTVNGVAVVGEGSKISIMFSNLGEVVGFRVDWPVYSKSATQRTVDLGTVWNRAETLAGRPAGDIAAEVKWMECGLFDPGAGFRGQAPLQAGCVIQSFEKDPSGELMVGTAHFVPAGDGIVLDENWLATYALEGSERTPCDVDPTFCGIGEEM